MIVITYTDTETMSKQNRADKIDKIDKIDITNIIYNAIMNNKLIFISAVPLAIGYYLQDTIFTRSVAKVTTDIPTFVKDIGIYKMLMLLLPYIISIILFYLSNMMTSKIMSNIELESIVELVNKLIISIKTSKKQIDVNEVISHIKKMSGTKYVYTLLMTYVMPTIIVATVLIYTYAINDGYYGFLIAITVIIMVSIMIGLEIMSIKKAYAMEESNNVLFDEIHEILLNIDSVITSNKQKEEVEHIKEVKNETHKKTFENILNNNTTTYGLQITNIFVASCFTYMAYRLYINNKIDEAGLTSTVILTLLFMDYYNMSIKAVGEIISSAGRYAETREYFLNFLIDNSENEENNNENFDMYKNNKNNTIELIDVVPNDMNINVKKINITVKYNKITGLIGQIGSGKSTILKMICGLVKYNGKILVNGENIENMEHARKTKIIAYIPQHPKLFNKSIMYNLKYGTELSEEEVANKIVKMGLGQFINNFSDKFATIVGKEGCKISGGQRQFVYFIRALLQNKKIFLLDEPSASLDNKTSDLLINLIESSVETDDKTFLITTHDKKMMSIFHNTIEIK
jgi:ABC-type bacteriocin/lantibiotic exporter with double-glycine peptidase domain